MKVVILGAGHVGYEIAKQLSFDEHDVSIIDHDIEVIKKVGDKLDVKPVCGNAVDTNILREAGIADANILVAATSSDEANIVACQISDFMFGTETKIARISNKAYFEHNILGKNKLTVDMMASPELEIASIIKRSISIHGALDVISCLDDKIRIVCAQCQKTSEFVNIPLKFISTITNDFPMAILFIQRDNISFIPDKKDTIQEGDNVYFAVAQTDMHKAIQLFQNTELDTNSIVIIGGGTIGKEIIRSMSEDNPDISIKIIESDIKEAEKLSEEFENIETLYGNALDTDIINKSLISNAEATIAITNNDKINVLSCLLAKKYGAKRVAAMVSDITNVPLFYTLGINTILDSRKVIVSKILHYIKKGGADSIFTFADNTIEILTVNVTNNSRAIGILIDDLGSDNLIIAALVRGEKTFILPKRMVINAGDKILLSVEKTTAPKIINLFKDNPKYLA